MVAIEETMAASHNPDLDTRYTMLGVVVAVPEDSPSSHPSMAAASCLGVSPFAFRPAFTFVGGSPEPVAAAGSRPWAAFEEHSQVAAEGTPCLVTAFTTVEGSRPEAVAFAIVGSPLVAAAVGTAVASDQDSLGVACPSFEAAGAS